MSLSSSGNGNLNSSGFAVQSNTSPRNTLLKPVMGGGLGIDYAYVR